MALIQINPPHVYIYIIPTGREAQLHHLSPVSSSPTKAAFHGDSTLPLLYQPPVTYSLTANREINPGISLTSVAPHLPHIG